MNKGKINNTDLSEPLIGDHSKRGFKFTNE